MQLTKQGRNLLYDYILCVVCIITIITLLTMVRKKCVHALNVYNFLTTNDSKKKGEKILSLLCVNVQLASYILAPNSVGMYAP